MKKVLLWIAAVVFGVPAVLIGGLLLWINLADRTNGTLVSSGQEREFLLHVPESYDATTPTPLVISMHAAALWPAHQQNVSRWNRLADEEGFLVVYPAGTDFPRTFGAVRPGPRLERDVRFIADLIDSLATAYTLDPARVYADGLSNGAGMAFVLSCALSHRIAAVGMVGAAKLVPDDWCEPERPVPLMAFHGALDEIVPYGGGPLGDPFNPVKSEFAPVREWVQAWAERNGCDPEPAESRVAPTVTRFAYAGCESGADVVLHRVDDGGHSWPGGRPIAEWRVGPTSTAIDATERLWQFYQDHPMSGAGP